MRWNRQLVRWLCLVAIPLLFELPAVLTSTRFELTALRLSLDVPLLLTLWLAWLGSSRRRLPLFALRAAAGILVVFRFDQWVGWSLLRDEPLLYDQLFMVRHLWALIGDLMSPITLLVLFGVAAGVMLIGFSVRALLREASALAAPSQRRRTLHVLALFWCVLLALRMSELSRADPPVTWLTPKLVLNLQKSVQTYASVQRRLRQSPYAAYARLKLHQRPDVLLFIVESYGRLLSLERGTHTRHAALLAELEKQLQAAGFHSASAFATATVSGGRSWIAEGTILMGTPIHYEAEFHHIIAHRPPSFVGFLNQNGYDSALLAPADRDRAGFHPENRYGFAQLFSYDKLHYEGPSIGWGLVPDQYSLAFIERNFLRGAQKPVFLDFHMVSSHAPWTEVPTLETDPARLLSSVNAAPHQAPLHAGSVVTPFRRYVRGSSIYADMNQFDAAMREGYQATIEYDLRAIAQALARREKDAFVIVLGDHQPPVIAREDKSFDTPVHVLSRDSARLAPLLAHGFVEGLALDASTPPALEQAGLFSLFVHSLVAAGCDGCELPEVLPQGDRLLR